MKLTFDGERYMLVDTRFGDRHIPRKAGFIGHYVGEGKDRVFHYWYTQDPERAARLAQYADPTCSAVLRKIRKDYEATRDASRATESDIVIPAPKGKEYFPFQKAGIAFALARPSTLIGDEMGLGKTIQAIGMTNADQSLNRILVVTKASLRINWKREFEAWLCRPLTIGVASGGKPMLNEEGKIVQAGEWPTDTNIVIINYDILIYHLENLHGEVWDLIVLDEGHSIKNKKALRTVAIVGGSLTIKPPKPRRKKGEPVPPIDPKAPKPRVISLQPVRARRKLWLSGTPMPNRMEEMWTAVSYLDPQTWGATHNTSMYYKYGMKFCGGHSVYIPALKTSKIDMSGSSNMEEFQHRIRSTIMVRRLKRDVLPELPNKIRQVLELPTNGATELVADEWKAYEKHAERHLAVKLAEEMAKASDNPADYVRTIARLREEKKAAFGQLSILRHAVGRAKVPYVLDHVLDAIESSPDRKLIVFAYHTDVINTIIDQLRKHKINTVRIIGADTEKARQNAIDGFQNDPAVRVFVGNVVAAGEGITLTASSHVVFCELDWTPKNIIQAEDRAHRIGQKESVLVQHLVFDGSLDVRIAKIILQKQAIADRALDKTTPEVQAEFDQPVYDEVAATADMRRVDIDRIAKKLTPVHIGAIHQGLRTLARICDGAKNLDGIGFNKIDAKLGSDLARRPVLTPREAALGRRITLKYKRQLGDDLISVIKPLEGETS
jgi:SWI/SNF-related matrix-associated actin-dependent regulator of chromatin subfamily A-like protein 1